MQGLSVSEMLGSNYYMLIRLATKYTRCKGELELDSEKIWRQLYFSFWQTGMEKNDFS